MDGGGGGLLLSVIPLVIQREPSVARVPLLTWEAVTQGCLFVLWPFVQVDTYLGFRTLVCFYFLHNSPYASPFSLTNCELGRAAHFFIPVTLHMVAAHPVIGG